MHGGWSGHGHGGGAAGTVILGGVDADWYAHGAGGAPCAKPKGYTPKNVYKLKRKIEDQAPMVPGLNHAPLKTILVAWCSRLLYKK